ncbi:hypothetical protein Tco_1558528, partial [Tanacetum coccineum]
IEFPVKNLYADFLHADCVDNHFDPLDYWKYEDVYGGGCFDVSCSFKGFDWIDEPVGFDDCSLSGKSKDEFSNNLLHTDNDVHSFFDAAVKNGSIHLYVAHKKQNFGKYYYKNIEWEEDDAGLRCCSSTPFDTRYKRKISKSKETGVIHDEGAGRKRKKSLVNGGNKGKEKVFEDEGADNKRKKTLVTRAMVNGKAKMVEVEGVVKTGRDKEKVVKVESE